MAQSSVEKTTIETKDDSFLKKTARPMVNMIRTIVKKVGRKFSEYNANYYYGPTAHDYESVRVKQEWWHAENQVVADLLKELPNGLSVLDVPLGTGRFLPLYAEKQMKITGIDISHAMISTAKGLRAEIAKNCKLDIGDARSLPYANNSFDLVLSFRFLDGIIMFKDEKKVLAELARVSKKYLILEVFSVPNGDDSKLLIKNAKENEPLMGRLSDAERKKLFEGFGIKIVKKVPAALEEGLRQVVYLCEKSDKV